MKKVAFCSDRPLGESFPEATRVAIMKYLDVGQYISRVFVPAGVFSSCVDWSLLASGLEVAAVVLVNVSDACAVGISREISREASSIDVYEVCAGQLLKLKDLVVAGKKLALVLHAPDPRGEWATE